MVYQVTWYACSVCHALYDVLDDATRCEERGVPLYAYEVGQLIPELSVVVLERTAVRHRSGHLPAYILTEAGGTNRVKTKEASMVRRIRGACTCSICKTLHESAEHARLCEKLGEPKFAWRLGYNFPSGVEIRRRETVLTASGQHAPFYCCWDYEDKRFRYFSEEELKRL